MLEITASCRGVEHAFCCGCVVVPCFTHNKRHLPNAPSPSCPFVCLPESPVRSQVTYLLWISRPNPALAGVYSRGQWLTGLTLCRKTQIQGTLSKGPLFFSKRCFIGCRWIVYRLILHSLLVFWSLNRHLWCGVQRGTHRLEYSVTSAAKTVPIRKTVSNHRRLAEGRRQRKGSSCCRWIGSGSSVQHST